MKKTVITLLLVLPFLLIYFISFTGRILSEYTHIYVERIVCLDEKGNEYKTGDYIRIAKDDEYDLNIKIYPELATNKEVVISNSDKGVCSVDNETHIVKGLAYGVSKLIITSKDRHYVQYEIQINVTDDDIKEIIPSVSSVSIMKGRSETVSVSILPTTTLIGNRGLVWSSQDETIATVTDSGVIKGVEIGTTKIIVRSNYRPNVFAEINVTVTALFEKGVQFDSDIEPPYKYLVNEREFDLKEITEVKLDGRTIDDVVYSVENNYNATQVDLSQLGTGRIVFLGSGKDTTVVIKVVVYDTLGQEYSDSIILWYVE